MSKTGKIDYAKLLGFDAVSDAFCGSVDFQDEALDSRLGAKVGTETWAACDSASECAGSAAKAGGIDFAKLLGFDGVSDQVSGDVDFQDETMNAKLGAKVGVEVMA